MTETTAPARLTYADVLARVQPIVEAAPTSSPGCNYFHLVDGPDGLDSLGAPMCVVGHAFAEELRPLIQRRTYENSARFGVLPLLDAGLDLTPKARKFLSAIQYEQDTKKPWSEALEIALDVVSYLDEDGHWTGPRD